jgi:hypothetical protein
MLLIRPEQLAALDRAAFELYIGRLATFLAEEYPELLRMADALPFARAAAEEARRHGLESEDDLAMYAEAALILGLRFEDDPRHAWAADILRDETIGTPSERIGYLWERLDHA